VYGRAVKIPEIDLAVGKAVAFRLVDTGQHFYGKGKVIRVKGREPIDVCRQSANARGIKIEGPATLEFA
jgi:hypothetical protein